VRSRKGKPKAKISGWQKGRTSKNKVARVPAARLMLGLLIFVIELMDEVADAKCEALAGKN
jgi:hypothetical protein